MLYNNIISRIDGNIDVAEQYIIGAVSYLKRKNDGRSDKDRIRADFEINRGIEKYERELTTMLNLSDTAFESLIGSSVDLTPNVRIVKDVLSKVKCANFFTDDAKEESTKAKNMARMLLEICYIVSGVKYEMRKVGEKKRKTKAKPKPILKPKPLQGGLF